MGRGEMCGAVVLAPGVGGAAVALEGEDGLDDLAGARLALKERGHLVEGGCAHGQFSAKKE
jgi:hypothetical protein